MGIRYGGESGEAYGFRMTVEAPASASVATPVLPGTLWKLAGTDADSSGYKAALLDDGDDMSKVVFLQATERAHEVGPMTMAVISPFSQIRRLPYNSGAAPSLGQSIEAAADVSATGYGVKGKAFDGDGYVLRVDTDLLEVEVLC